jgi:hypothetical protein
MSTSQLGSGELNNRGVEGMRAGDPSLAVRHFRAALELTSRGLTHQPSEPGTGSTAVFGSSAFLPFEESAVDQESSCYTSEPIIMIVRGPEAAEPTTAYTHEDNDDPLHIMTISSAIIIYNMALTYHRTGQSASQSRFLFKARQLYEKSVLLLEPIYDSQQGLLDTACRMVLTASLHNLTQISLYDGLEVFCSPSGASAA